jgi:AcrR family transcriptional regulator
MSVAKQRGAIAWAPAPNRSNASSARGKRTRDAILKSAIAVFGQQGFADATVLDIAEHAGLASGTVYQYFVDKADIFECLLQNLMEQLDRETRFPADENGRLIVREPFLRYLRIYREYASIFRAWWELLEPDSAFAPHWLAVHDRWRREMIRVVEDGQAIDLIDEEVDSVVTADLIVAAFERQMFVRIILGWEDDATDEEMADVLSQLLGSGASDRS